LENVMIIGNNLHVDAFYDKATSTISYLVMDRETLQCALIDSVLDYDPKSGRTCTASADRLIERVAELNANVQWVLETHVHADHLSAAAYLKAKLGGHTAIGAHITQVTESLWHAVQCRTWLRPRWQPVRCAVRRRRRFPHR
jgi:Zn-dependent hydrolases, including glyoxylases